MFTRGPWRTSSPAHGEAFQAYSLVWIREPSLVGRHQEFHGKLRLTEGLRRWLNRADREREEEIRKRVKLAALALR